MHWKIAQSCRSPKDKVSARLRYHVSNSVVFVHRAGTLAKNIRPLSKLFSKAEPLPFEKEIDINLVYSSCLKHANEMLLGDPRQADQRTQSFPYPIVIHQSQLDPAARALKRQAPCLHMHSSTRQAQNASTCSLGRRDVEVIICMITRDFSVISNDVTGVSLSLSLSTTTHKSHRSPLERVPHSILEACRHKVYPPPSTCTNK